MAHSEADTTHSVVADGFQLSTERRAKERLEFERALKEKELLRAQMEERQAREQEEREQEEITRLRQEQVSVNFCNDGILIDFEPYSMVYKIFYLVGLLKKKSD